LLAFIGEATRYRNLQEGHREHMGAGRPSLADRAGLDVKLTDRPDGRVDVTLTDDSGEVIFTNDYANAESARVQIRKWVQEHYQVDTQEVSKPKPPKPRVRTLGPQPSHLVQMMRDRADDNEEQAIERRQEADALETEAKRLRAAADALAGPDA
jgi:hypothetical protein